MEIELNSSVFRVAAIKKQTKAKLFGDTEVGDEIRFSMYMKRTGQASGGGVYASIVKVTNLTKGTSDKSKSQTEVSSILSKFFELEEIV